MCDHGSLAEILDMQQILLFSNTVHVLNNKFISFEIRKKSINKFYKFLPFGHNQLAGNSKNTIMFSPCAQCLKTTKFVACLISQPEIHGRTYFNDY